MEARTPPCPPIIRPAQSYNAAEQPLNAIPLQGCLAEVEGRCEESDCKEEVEYDHQTRKEAECLDSYIVSNMCFSHLTYFSKL